MIKKTLAFFKTNKLLKNLSVYFASQLITALLPIIIIPIISRTLSLNDYGSYSLYKSIFGFLTPLVGLSFSNAVVRKYYNIEKEHFKSYMLTLMTTITAAAVLIYLFISIDLKFLLQILKITDPSILYFALAVTYFTSISAILVGYYRVVDDTKKYLTTNLFIIILTLIGVFLIKNYQILTLINLMWIHLIAIFASVVFNLTTFFRSEKSIHINFTYLNDTIKYCFPLIIFSLLAQIYALGDRFFINYYLGKDNLALYSAGLQMAFLIPMIGQSIQLAWTPYVFEQMTNNQKNHKLSQITYMFCGVLVFFSIAYCVIYPFIFKIFLPITYQSVLQYYYLFIIAGLFQSLYWLYNPFLLFYEKNAYFIYITLIAAIVSITLNFIFVKNGLIWIAVIFALSWATQFVCLLIAIMYVKNSKKNKL